MNQTQDYITLKPIVDRFKEAASKITDGEIEWLIKDELRQQIREQVHLAYTVNSLLDKILEDEDYWTGLIKKYLKEQIEECFKRR